MKAVRPVRLELELPAGATLVGGKQKQEIGQLEGRSNKLEVAYVRRFADRQSRQGGMADPRAAGRHADLERHRRARRDDPAADRVGRRLIGGPAPARTN